MTNSGPPEPLNKQHFESSDGKEGKTQVLLHLLSSYYTKRAVQFSYLSAMTGQRGKEAEEEEEEEGEEGRSQREGVSKGKERVVEVTKV